MVHAKNYKISSKFVKVMPRILVASFFPDDDDSDIMSKVSEK